MADLRTRSLTGIVCVGVIGSAIMLAMWWWSRNAPFKEGVIVDPVKTQVPRW